MVTNSSKTISYDDQNFRQLIEELKTISSFEAIGSWDRRAQNEIQVITKVITDLETEIVQQNQVLRQAKQAYSEKSFFGRMFDGREEEKELNEHIKKCNQLESTLGKMATRLQESIDFTPNSPDEQKLLLKELRQRKKELQVEKREVTASMKAIRTDARQQSANAGQVFGLYYSSKVAASERRSIRYQKEAALRPHEDAKAAIERQIVQIDRDILWAEKFHE